MSGLKIPGTLLVSQTALTSVEDNKIVQNISADVHEETRIAATDSQGFVYHITVVKDINASITHTASGSSGTDDDSWALAAISVNSNDDAGAATILLPTGSANVPAGLVTALNVDDSAAGTFPVTVAISANNQGVLSATASISGSDVTASTAENVLKAQVVQWTIDANSAPTVGTGTQDVLSDVLSAEDLETQFASELATLVSTYNGVNTVASWSISFGAIAAATDNVLSQHARAKSATNANVFAAGEKIVAATHATFLVTVDDYQGNSVDIVADSGSAYNVFGVLEQSA